MKSVFCMRLSTAGVVFGWLGISVNLLYTILVIGSFGSCIQIARYVMKEITDLGVESEFDLHLRDVVIFINYTLYFCLANALLGLLSSILLVLGTLKKRHLMLLPRLVLTITELIGVIACLLIYTCFGFDEIEELFDPIFICISIGIFILTVLEFYVYWGIYSLFKEIRLSRTFQKGNTLSF